MLLLLIIFTVKSLQKEQNSKNLLLRPQSAGIDQQSPQSDSTPWTLTLPEGLFKTLLMKLWKIWTVMWSPQCPWFQWLRNTLSSNRECRRTLENSISKILRRKIRIQCTTMNSCPTELQYLRNRKLSLFYDIFCWKISKVLNILK